MQTRIDALVPVHMHLDLFPLESSAALGLETLQVGPDHIVLRTRRHPLRELAGAIRILFPARFLFALAPNLDLHSVNWTVIWAPNCAEDQSLGWFALVVLRWKASSSGGGTANGKNRKYAQRDRQRR